MEQYQITESADLLNEDGTLKQAGWAKDLLSGSITLYQPPSLESMAIPTPLPESKHAFYCNQKINCLPVEGELSLA